jgi:hypothetical protein
MIEESFTSWTSGNSTSHRCDGIDEETTPMREHPPTPTTSAKNSGEDDLQRLLALLTQFEVARRFRTAKKFG